MRILSALTGLHFSQAKRREPKATWGQIVPPLPAILKQRHAGFRVAAWFTHQQPSDLALGRRALAGFNCPAFPDDSRFCCPVFSDKWPSLCATNRCPRSTCGLRHKSLPYCSFSERRGLIPDTDEREDRSFAANGSGIDHVGDYFWNRSTPLLSGLAKQSPDQARTVRIVGLNRESKRHGNHGNLVDGAALAKHVQVSARFPGMHSAHFRVRPV